HEAGHGTCAPWTQASGRSVADRALRSGHRTVSPVSVRERPAARDVCGSQGVSRERRARESRSHEHAARARGPLSHPRSPPRRVRLPRADSGEDATLARKTSTEVAGVREAAAGTAAAAEAWFF